MDSINLYLDSDQVMPYMKKLEEMNKYDPEHYDSVAYNFCTYVAKRKTEIVNNYNLNRLLKRKNFDKFVISKSMMDYLSALTGLSYLKENSNTNVKKLEKVSIIKKNKEVV